MLHIKNNQLPYSIKMALKRVCNTYGYTFDFHKRASLGETLNRFGWSLNDLLKESMKRDVVPLHYSDSFLQFLVQNKDKSKIFSRMISWRQFANTKHCNYVTLRKGDRLITFHPKPELQEVENGVWKREGRQEIKISALLQRLYGKRCLRFFTNEDIEIATKLIKLENEPITMEVTQRPSEVYIYGGDGWAQSSCMANRHLDMFEIYDSNPEKFEGILFLKNGEVIGRCLRVNADGGFTYYDRFYYKLEHHLEGIKSLLDESNATYKAFNNYRDKDIFYSKEKGSFGKEISVSISGEYYDYYPYMDTLTYLYDGKLHNSTPDNNEDPIEYYELNCTDGNYEIQSSGIWCSYSDRYISNEVAVYISYGLHSGEYVHQDYAMYSESNDSWILA